MIRKLKNLAHLGLAIIANIIYGFPGKKLTVIGVTGTDGKTTTSSLIYHILTKAGRKAVMVTTIGAYMGDKMFSTGFHVTTPSAFTLQKFLRRAVNEKFEFAVIETSSHGIDQNRIWGIPYKVAAITNISHEHLDYHANFEDYLNTKFKLLKSASTSIVNIDDKDIMSHARELRNKVVTYSLKSDADYNLNNTEIGTQLFGTFNLYNCLAAVAVCNEICLSKDEITEGIKTFKPPLGRQNIVYNGDYKVMVDFAHTPNAIEKLLSEVKKTNPTRLIHLFGAPGLRDVSKRPLMGAASAKFADVICLAPDDPRTEQVPDINSRIRAGIPDNFKLHENLFEFEDRMEAIDFVISRARPGDYIVLTGKGHEPTLALASGELPWNESEIVLKTIKKDQD